MDARVELERQLANLKTKFLGKIDTRLGEITLIEHEDGEKLRETPVSPKKKNQPLVKPVKKEEVKSKTEKQQEKVEQNRAKQNEKYKLVKDANPSKIMTNDNAVTKALKKILINLKSVNLDSQSLGTYLTTLETQQKELDFDRAKVTEEKNTKKKDAEETKGKPLPSLQLVIDQINEVKNLLDQIKRVEEEERDAQAFVLARQVAREDTAATIKRLDEEKAEKQHQEQLAAEKRRAEEAAKLKQQEVVKKPQQTEDAKVETDVADSIFGTMPPSFAPVKKVKEPTSQPIVVTQPIAVVVSMAMTYVAGDGTEQQPVVDNSAGSTTSQQEDASERNRAAEKFREYARQLIDTDWRWWVNLLKLFNAQTTQGYKAAQLNNLADSITDKTATNANYIAKIKEAKKDGRLIKGFFFSHNTKNLLTNAENGQAGLGISEPAKAKKA